MLLAYCSSSSGFFVLGGGTLGVLSFPASSVGLLSQLQCVCGVLSQVLSSLFALHVPLVYGELRWGNCMGESLQTQVPGSCLERQTRISRDRSLH